MAVEQLPAGVFVIGGQPTLSGWVLPTAQYGFEEDAENKTDAAGRFLAKLTFSRRPTLNVTLEAESGTTLTTYESGGAIASGVFTNGGGDATAWKIRSAVRTKTRGVVQVVLDLIAQTDLLA
jgi:hypothetical protein